METIKDLLVVEDAVIVAGCDPVIRSFNITTGEKKQFLGHKGWVYCLAYHNGFLFSGGDDNMVRCWHLESSRQIEILEAHTNGVMAIELCRGLLITSSFDKYVITWDIEEIE